MKETTPWVVAMLVFVAVGAGGYYWYVRQNPPITLPPGSAPVAVAPPVADAPPLPPWAASAPPIQHPIEAASAPRQEPLALAAPEQAGSVIEQALTDLLGRQAVLSMLQLDNFAARVVATVDNLPTRHAAARMWPVNPAPGKLLVVERGDGTYLAPGNAERYAPLVRLIESVDTAKAVGLYVKLYPLFQRAYEELGYPGRYFNDRLIEVIDHLLATPSVGGPLRVRLPEVSGPIQPARPWVMYEAADRELESRSAGQRMLLRVGDDNAARLKAKLREIRQLIARQQQAAR